MWFGMTSILCAMTFSEMCHCESFKSTSHVETSVGSVCPHFPKLSVDHPPLAADPTRRKVFPLCFEQASTSRRRLDFIALWLEHNMILSSVTHISFHFHTKKKNVVL